MAEDKNLSQQQTKQQSDAGIGNNSLPVIDEDLNGRRDGPSPATSTQSKNNHESGKSGKADNSKASAAEEGGKDNSETDSIKIGGININSYATKKSLAQAILDLALLAANASQLKFILQAGHEHEFYTLILWLVISSISLQAIQAITCIILALIFDIRNADQQRSAEIINNVSLSMVIVIVVLNVIISAFDMKSPYEIKH